MVRCFLELLLQWYCETSCRWATACNMPSLQLDSQVFGIATIAQSKTGFYFLQLLLGFCLNHCKLQLETAMFNMSSATCNGFLFPMLRDKFQEELNRVRPAYFVQPLQAPKSYETSCKEGMLHAAIFLQLFPQEA